MVFMDLAKFLNFDKVFLCIDPKDSIKFRSGFSHIKIGNLKDYLMLWRTILVKETL